jgi:endonuclease YncB( thermonuclease family)
MIYIYKASVIRVIDGDTFQLMIDQGWSGFTEQKMRLYGIDAPEMRTNAGKDIRDALRMQYLAGSKVIVQSIEGPKKKQFQDKFGRYLAIIYDAMPEDPQAITNGQKILEVAPLSLNSRLINDGLVKERYW